VITTAVFANSRKKTKTTLAVKTRELVHLETKKMTGRLFLFFFLFSFKLQSRKLSAPIEQ
jgi:hypothetical protein